MWKSRLEALREARKWHRVAVFSEHKLVTIRLRHSDTTAANGFHEQILRSEYPRLAYQFDGFEAKALLLVRGKVTPSTLSIDSSGL